MAATDISGTTETAGVGGNNGAIPPGTQFKSDNKDTAGPMGGQPYDAAPRPHTVVDTTAVAGGQNTHHKNDPTQYMTGTLDTQSGGGSPIQHKTQTYRAPSNPPGASNVDTSWTDRPTTDGNKNPSQVNQYQTGTMDTRDPSYALQTTSGNDPVAPAGAPTVEAKPRGALVTITPVADPAGARLRGYRVEAATVSDPSKTPTPGSGAGVEFLGRDATSVTMGTLEPNRYYKFRYAAFNDNGTGQFSAWSAAIQPINPDDNISGTPSAPTYATGIAEVNRVNPVYRPDGSVVGGTGGTPGPVATATAAQGTAGQIVVNWTAPTYGSAVTGYRVTLSGGATVTVGVVLTTTFSGQTTGVAQTATVVPLSAKGDGAPKTTNAVSPT